ncbi:MAG: flavodoxin-dependent (E)-4-hydroxy-3-methylbut-2-enyl-diphosphate synthase [Firmicutes bacterium]|nr:flavodoxin-dependent (E)-4-hydroxy-3-methylbut-2-enyl-diphosphate synthase [Bacillota bacterium]
MTRRIARGVRVGSLLIGGLAPVSVQSMTKTDTRDIANTRAEVRRLEEAGAELVRLAIPDLEAAQALGAIKRAARVPLVADIHFDYRLALEALEQGVDKLRINPGNIGGKDRVKALAEAARVRGVPIRIGVNSGSVERELLEKYGGATAEAMVESALEHIRLLERESFLDIVVSLKASDVPRTLRAYRLLADQVDYPFHIGITEAGTVWSGTVKSVAGLGALLSQGLGDTLRVSLTGPAEEEIRVGREILKAMGWLQNGVEVISCPTCGRTEIDLVRTANAVEEALADLTVPLKVAVMGCAVNGPGEAREADVGLAGGRGFGLLFRRGEIVGRVTAEEMSEALIRLARAEAGGKSEPRLARGVERRQGDR